MMLRTRVVVTGLVVAIPAAAMAVVVVDRLRAGDARTTIERVVRSQINDQVRERCESDPTWFLTGPLIGRPPNGVFFSPDPDQLPPRPKPAEQPFELFAYDAEFIGSSSATPRLPVDLRNALRVRPAAIVAPYQTAEGTGVQMAVPTGWPNSVCSYFLGRLAPPPHQRSERLAVMFGTFAVVFLAAMGASAETVVRVRRLARAARGSVSGGYGSIAPDRHRDELSSLTFMFNDATNELGVRKSRIDDQNTALHRLVQTSEQEIGVPLRQLTDRIASLALDEPQQRAGLAGVLHEAHDLAARVENLAAAARLRMTSGAGITLGPVDLNDVTRRVAEIYLPIAHAAGVALQVSVPDAPVTITGDAALIQRAIGNVVDNAIRYNQAGGEVMVTLSRAPTEHRFRLCVTDNGRGVTEEAFRGLTAIRRFRGDESRHRRPGAPGLGLAIAREVADRFGLQFDLKRPGAGGFEVEFSGNL
jgi:signal transduction histidine kinase